MTEMDFNNIQNIFSHLSEIGWGENKIFSNTQNDIDFLYEVIQGMSGTAIILNRAYYLENGGLKNINEWYEEIKMEDNFQSYMLKNYNFIKGEFIFEKTIENLEKISGVFLKYYHYKELYINNEYMCKSCGNTGKFDPETSFCFECGDDNWIQIS